MSINKKFNNKEFEDKVGYTADSLLEMFKLFAAARSPYEQVWKLLDSMDRGKFWNSFSEATSNYFIKPDTNWINYVKTNMVNSLYVGSYKGTVFPRKADYNREADAINEFIEYILNKLEFPYLQLMAGGKAALLNFGAIEFGWNTDITDGCESLFIGDLEARFIDNLSVYLDPSVKEYQKGKAIFLAETQTIVELLAEKRFKNRLTYYLKEIRDEDSAQHSDIAVYADGRTPTSRDKTVRLITAYYKHTDPDTGAYRIDKVWMIDDGFILDIQQDIRPKTFPVKILYANPPVDDPYGTSTATLVLYNVMSINLLDAIESSMLYMSANRPRIISRRSNLNEDDFARNGNLPKKLWVVDGEPGNVVRYVDMPELPRDRHLLRERLEMGIMRISGIDDRYTGRDTGSVQTTGGMDINNQRVTMSDNTRIGMLQKFVKDVTELVLQFHLEHSKQREFPRLTGDGRVDEVKVLDFEDMRTNHVKFDFTVNIGPNLPANLMRMQEAANVLLEKQMQYQFNPAIITPEEWARFQDLPFKFQILRRMEDERRRDDVEELQSDIVNYAGSVEQGMQPESAINMLASERSFKRSNPSGKLGNVQARQKG